METSIMKISEPLFDATTAAKLCRLFKDEENFLFHLKNLKQTREGLYHIQESRPELAQAIKPQFDTLNELIGVLVSTHSATQAYHQL